MQTTDTAIQLPSYDEVSESLLPLDLSMSVSELHGIMCAYLATAADQDGEVYLQSLIVNKQDVNMRGALRQLFHVYAISQEQLKQNVFDVQLLLPDESVSIAAQAQAFSEWCEGFTHGLVISGVDLNQCVDEDTQEAIQHIMEFAQLDYESLQVNDDDERALMELIEYARMAVMHIHNDVLLHSLKPDGSEAAH